MHMESTKGNLVLYTGDCTSWSPIQILTQSDRIYILSEKDTDLGNCRFLTTQKKRKKKELNRFFKSRGLPMASHVIMFLLIKE